MRRLDLLLIGVLTVAAVLGALRGIDPAFVMGALIMASVIVRTG